MMPRWINGIPDSECLALYGLWIVHDEAPMSREAKVVKGHASKSQKPKKSGK